MCEVITTSIEGGNKEYLDWIGKVVPLQKWASTVNVIFDLLSVFFTTSNLIQINLVHLWLRIFLLLYLLATKQWVYCVILCFLQMQNKSSSFSYQLVYSESNWILFISGDFNNVPHSARCFEVYIQPVHSMSWHLTSQCSNPLNHSHSSNILFKFRKSCPLSSLTSSYPPWRSPPPCFSTSETCLSWRMTGRYPGVSTSLSPRSPPPSRWAQRCSVRNTAFLCRTKTLRVSSWPAGQHQLSWRESSNQDISFQIWQTSIHGKRTVGGTGIQECQSIWGQFSGLEGKRGWYWIKKMLTINIKQFKSYPCPCFGVSHAKRDQNLANNIILKISIKIFERYLTCRCGHRSWQSLDTPTAPPPTDHWHPLRCSTSGLRCGSGLRPRYSCPDPP